MSTPRWPEELADALRELWAGDLSCSQIAAKLNEQFGSTLTKNSIIGKTHRLKLPHRAARPIVRVHRVTHQRVTKMPASPFNRFPAHARKAKAAKMRGGTHPLGLPPGEPKMPLPVSKPIPAPDCKPVTLIDIGNRQCRYVVGDVCGPETLMCGAPEQRNSLCAFHVRLCWHPRPNRPSNPLGRTRKSSLVPFIGEVAFS